MTGNRFKVTVEWRDFRGQTGVGRLVTLPSDESRLFWFFSPNNYELLTKILNGCGINDRFWVFSAATTNVEYTLTVVDTQTGVAKVYVNPLGRSAASLTDTSAFDTCP